MIIKSGRWPCARAATLLAASLAAGLLAVGPVREGWAQNVTSLKGFKYGEKYPGSEQLKTLLTGEKAYGEPGRPFPIEGLKILTFMPDGKTNMVVTAPECVFDMAREEASSSGPIHISSNSGQMEMRGIGFLWKKSSGLINILSNVETDIVQGSTNAPVRITAGQFEFNNETRRARYWTRVKAEDSQLDLSSEMLTVQLKTTGGGFETLVAETNVVIVAKAQQSRAQGERAVYDGATEELRLTGHPEWQRGPQWGRGEVLVFDRCDQSFTATHDVEVRLPRAEISGQRSVVSDQRSVVSDQRSEVSDQRAEGGGQGAEPGIPMIHVYSEKLIALTNLTTFSDDVRVKDGTNTLSSRTLRLESTDGEQKPHRMVASGDVLFEQANRRLTAQEAVYTTETGVIEFGGEPAWQSGPNSGSAQRLSYDQTTETFRGRGGSRVLIEAKNDGSSGFALFPPLASSTGAPRLQEVETRKVEIVSDELDLAGDVATFEGNVRSRDLTSGLADQRLASQRMIVYFRPGGGQVERLVALGSVVFEQGRQGVTNGPAAYSLLTCGKLTSEQSRSSGAMERLTAEENVVWVEGSQRAEGNKAVYTSTNDVLVIYGDAARPPTLENAQGKLWGEGRITLDRRANRAIAPGLIRIEGVAQSRSE